MKKIIAGILRLLSWRGLLWADRICPIDIPEEAATEPEPTPEPEPMPSQPSIKEISYQRWQEVNGDKTLRLDYPLGADDIVLDIGGFEGQWASDIFARYLSEIHIFEPVPHFAEAIRKRFSRNPRIHIHELALGGVDGMLNMAVVGDASSSLLIAEQHTSVQVRRFSDAMHEHGWEEIALMKVNIEGGEYELLEHLLDTGLATQVKNLQVQFHDFVPDAQCRMQAIQERLRATHELTYDFPFIWENWKRKDSIE